MAKKMTELTVFVAAPTDVDAEVQRLQDVIRDLNEIYGEQFGVKLKTVHWRTSACPAVGSDPQAVINEQIGDSYDVFVGILWKSFGRPTPRAPSGTVEEFERAYSRWQASPDEIQILFYFKDLAPARLSDIDPDSLARINDFRASWRDRGLYCTFSHSEQFASLVQKHLGKLQVNWGKTWGRGAPCPDASQGVPSAEASSKPYWPIQPTYLDFFDEYEESLESAMEVFAKWDERTHSLRGEVQERMASGRSRLQEARTRHEGTAVVDFLMQPVQSLGSSLRQDMPAFVAAHRAAKRSLGLAAADLLESYDESDRSELERLLPKIRQVKKEYSVGLEKLRELEDTIRGFATDLAGVRRPRRVLLTHLREVRKEMESLLDSLNSAEAVIERVIGRQNSA